MKTKQWFEDDAFWERFYGPLFPEHRWIHAPDEVEQVLALAGAIPPDAAVLDLCCGPGRHAVELARRGHAVTGVDRTRSFLDRAARFAEAREQRVEWVESEMLDFRCEGAFDLCVNLFTSFGYYEIDDDNLKVLKNVHASLKPGGKLIVDVTSKEWIAKNFLASSAHEMDEAGTVMVERRAIIDDFCRISNEWMIVSGDSVYRHRLIHWIYSGRELKRMFLDAGFADVHLCGGLDGSDFGIRSRRLVAVGTKRD